MGCCNSTENVCVAGANFHTFDPPLNLIEPKTQEAIKIIENHFYWMKDSRWSEKDKDMVNKFLHLLKINADKRNFILDKTTFILHPPFTLCNFMISIRNEITQYDDFKQQYLLKKAKAMVPTNYKTFIGSTIVRGIYTIYQNNRHTIDAGGVTASLYTFCIQHLLEKYFDQGTSNKFYTLKMPLKNTEKEVKNDLTIFGYFIAYSFENGLPFSGTLPTSLLYMCLNSYDMTKELEFRNIMMACEICDNQNLLNVYFNDVDDEKLKIWEQNRKDFLNDIYNEVIKLPAKEYDYIAKGFKNTTLYNKLKTWKETNKINDTFNVFNLIDRISSEFSYDGFIRLLNNSVIYVKDEKDYVLRHNEYPRFQKEFFINSVKKGLEIIKKIDDKNEIDPNNKLEVEIKQLIYQNPEKWDKEPSKLKQQIFIEEFFIFWSSTKTEIKDKNSNPYYINFITTTKQQNKIKLPQSHTCFNMIDIYCVNNTGVLSDTLFVDLWTSIFGSQGIALTGGMHKTTMKIPITIYGKTKKRMVYEKKGKYYVKYLSKKQNAYKYKKINNNIKVGGGATIEKKTLQLTSDVYRVTFYKESMNKHSQLIFNPYKKHESKMASKLQEQTTKWRAICKKISEYGIVSEKVTSNYIEIIGKEGTFKIYVTSPGNMQIILDIISKGKVAVSLSTFQFPGPQAPKASRALMPTFPPKNQNKIQIQKKSNQVPLDGRR
jgi:hypothetical protein